jgi:hypothetical protein
MSTPVKAEVSIDFDVPYCVGCKHYIESEVGQSFAKCAYIEFRNVVSGQMENRYCSQMRRARDSWDTDESMALRCDVHGKFFEPKPFVEVPPPPVQIEHAPAVPADLRDTWRVVVKSRPLRRKPSLLTRILGV